MSKRFLGDGLYLTRRMQLNHSEDFPENIIGSGKNEYGCMEGRWPDWLDLARTILSIEAERAKPEREAVTL